MEEFNVKEFNRKKKIADAKRKVKEAVNGAVEWVSENRDVAGLVVAGVTGTIMPVVKGAIKRVNLNKEQSLKDKYCYDRSLGHYWELKRKLNNREWSEVETRRKHGERLGDILKSMNVLR